jgi:hypothetical protein
MVVKNVKLDLTDKQIRSLKKGGSCFISQSQHGKGTKVPMTKIQYNKMMKNFNQNKRYKLKGDGVFDYLYEKFKKLLFREPGVLPPYSRKLLEKIGNEQITSLKVVRVPLGNTKLINALTLGQYEKALKTLKYDKMFHLSLEINNKYTLEKTAVPQIKVKLESTKPGAEVSVVHFKKHITISQLIENTIKYMGKEAFSSYNVTTNNCQHFTKSILDSNKLLNKHLLAFIEQDVSSIYKHLPEHAKILTDIATTTGAVYDKAVHGAGIDFNNLSIKGVILHFSSGEMSPLQDTYITTGSWNGYDVIQIWFYYPENMAIGGLGKIGWAQFPRSKALGWHLHDVENVRIYLKDNKPEVYVYSCHGVSESNIYTNPTINGGYLVVYVARNSHANYDSPGVKKRVKGFANDICDNDGTTEVIQFSGMKKITNDISYPGVSTISNTILPIPEKTLTHNERWLIDRNNGFI